MSLRPTPRAQVHQEFGSRTGDGDSLSVRSHPKGSFQQDRGSPIEAEVLEIYVHRCAAEVTNGSRYWNLSTAAERSA